MSENHLSVFAKAVGGLLEDGEGIVVHFEGEGYIVCKTADSEGGRIDILMDDEYLNYPDLNRAWMHDEPVGNA